MTPETGLDAVKTAGSGRLTVPMLLPIVGPLALLGGILVVARKQLVQTDTWVALVAGREVAQHGLPSVEHLTVIAHGRQWVDEQWLGQLLLYEVERVGGVGLVVAVCVAAALCGFGFAAAAAQSRGASPMSLLLWLLPALLVGPWGAEVRTQSLALPLFGLVLFLILRDPDLRKRSSLLALPVLCLWANVHGSVTLGAAIVAAHGLQALVRTGLRRLPAAMLLLAPAAVLASPYAFALPGYYREMLFHAPYAHYVSEWRPTTPTDAPIFFAVAAIAALVLLARRRRVEPIDRVVLAMTFAAALTAVRITPWFGLAVFAVLPPLMPRKAAAGADFTRIAATVTAAALAVGLFAALAWMSERDYGGPKSIIAALRAQPKTTDVFADLPLADWALWEAPELRGRIAYDGRPELMTRTEFIDDVVRFARLSPGWPTAVRGYALLVTNPAIAQRLTRSGHGWTAICAARGIVLLRHTSGHV